MTDQEQLEKIKKEVADLTEQKHLLLIQVRELEAKKKFADIEATEATQKVKDVESLYKLKIESGERRLVELLHDVTVKDSSLTSRLQDVAKKEAELSEIQKHINAEILSLDSQRKASVKLAEDSQRISDENILEAGKILSSAKETADSKLSALSIENSKNEALIKKLNDQQVNAEGSIKRLNELSEKIQDEKLEITKRNEELSAKTLDIEKREHDASTILGRIKTAQSDADQRASKLSDKERALHEKEVALDIKSREIAMLDKKVQSLINIHKLEGELNGRIG